MTSLSGLWAAVMSPHWSDLWILVNHGGELLVAVYVEPDGCPSAACPAETENDPRAIREDDSQALRVREVEERG